MVRIVPAELGEVDWKKESSAYTVEAGAGNTFGYIIDDIDFVNPNPQTPRTSAGQDRRPYLNAPQQREYDFDVSVLPVNPLVPFEMAVGARQHTSGIANGGTGYTYTWEDDNRLDTFTIKHYQSGFNTSDKTLEERFGGCKADLNITGSAGEPIEVSFTVTATKHRMLSGASASYPSQSLSQSGTYEYWMMDEVVWSGATNSISGIINSFDFGWSNGLEGRFNNRTGSGVANREAYSLVETTAAEKYDMSINVDIVDYDAYMRAYQDDEDFNLTLRFWKDNTDKTDGLEITLSGCTISDAPMPLRAEGNIDTDIELMPKKTKIQMFSTISGYGV